MSRIDGIFLGTWLFVAFVATVVFIFVVDDNTEMTVGDVCSSFFVCLVFTPVLICAPFICLAVKFFSIRIKTGNKP